MVATATAAYPSHRTGTRVVAVVTLSPEYPVRPPTLSLRQTGGAALPPGALQVSS